VVLVLLACASRPKPSYYITNDGRAYVHPSPMVLKHKAVKQDDPRAVCAGQFARALLKNDQVSTKKLISPEWYREYGLSPGDFMVSSLELWDWTPHDLCEITKVRGDTVTVRFTTRFNNLYDLVMMVANENGRFYVVPCGYNDIDGGAEPFWHWDSE